jgi:hypothetical protein
LDDAVAGLSKGGFLKPFSLFLVAAMVAAAMVLLTPSPGAISPSQQQCEAQGGSFERNQGQVECVIRGGKEPEVH